MTPPKANQYFLIVLRHGESCGTHGLTERGEKEIQRSADTLKNNNFEPNLIVSSTPLRAQKSTAIISKTFNNTARIRPRNLLRVEFDDFELAPFLSGISTEHKNVLISSHAETVEYFADKMLSNEDCAKLYSILPDNRQIHNIHEDKQSFILVVREGDALILSAESNENAPAQNFNELNWQLHSYLTGEDILRAPDKSHIPTGTKTGGMRMGYEAPLIK